MIKKEIRDLKIYMAGSLFTTSEQKLRKEEAEILAHILFGDGQYQEPKTPSDWQHVERIHEDQILAPINFKVNSENPTPIQIFTTDLVAIEAADYLLVDLSGITDMGVAVEIGIAHQMKKPIFAYYDDLRFGRTNTTNDPFRTNIGWNQFMIGCIYATNPHGKIYKTFAEAVEHMILFHKGS